MGGPSCSSLRPQKLSVMFLQENVILYLYLLLLPPPSPIPCPQSNALPGLRAEALLKKTDG